MRRWCLRTIFIMFGWRFYHCRSRLSVLAPVSAAAAASFEPGSMWRWCMASVPLFMLPHVLKDESKALELAMQLLSVLSSL